MLRVPMIVFCVNCEVYGWRPDTFAAALVRIIALQVRRDHRHRTGSTVDCRNGSQTRDGQQTTASPRAYRRFFCLQRTV